MCVGGVCERAAVLGGWQAPGGGRGTGTPSGTVVVQQEGQELCHRHTTQV